MSDALRALAPANSNDLREGGRWTRRQAAKNLVLFHLARLALAALGRLPRSSLLRLGRGLGALCHGLLRGERRRAEANVELALPDLSPDDRRALVARCFRALGAHLADAVALSSERTVAALPFEPGSLELLEEARREGRGVLFASAHLGPWERVAASIVRAGVPLVTLAREAYDPRLTRVLVALRERHGVRAIFRGGAGAALAIVRALRGGAVLGAPMDLASRVPSVVATFLGVPARTALGPARIALRTGSAVVVGSYAAGGVVRVTRVPLADLAATPQDEVRLTERINAELSLRILETPEDWPWMHRRFVGEDS